MGANQEKEKVNIELPTSKVQARTREEAGADLTAGDAVSAEKQKGPRGVRVRASASSFGPQAQLLVGVCVLGVKRAVAPEEDKTLLHNSV